MVSNSANWMPVGIGRQVPGNTLANQAAYGGTTHITRDEIPIPTSATASVFASAKGEMADSAPVNKNLFEQVGGFERIHQVTILFYEKVYKHRWLRKFFLSVDQAHIARQQAEFMQGVFGGPKIFCGHTPGRAHPHIRITNEVYDLRQELLRQALVEQKIKPEIARHWLDLDERFRKRLVKGSTDCKKRYASDSIIDPSR